MRIGLLGASRIAPKAIIAPAAERDDVVIAVVAARDRARAADYAATHGISRVLDSYDALVEAEDVDLVYCALPPPQHLDIALKALAAGKMLLIEKPYAMDAKAAAQIARASATSGKAALEAFHYRFHPQFRRALALVQSGALGEITGASGYFHADIPAREGEIRWIPELGGGATMDLGCYVLHALRVLTGKEPIVCNLEAEVVAGVDVAVGADLAFGDIPSRVGWSMKAQRDDALCLEGTRATMRLNGFCAPQRGGSMTLVSAEGSQTTHAETSTSYAAQLEHVVAVWRGECQPLTGGEDAVATMLAIDACRRAAGVCFEVGTGLAPT